MRSLIIIFSFTLIGCGLLYPPVKFQAINDKGELKLQANSSRFTALQFIYLQRPLFGEGEVIGSIAPAFWNNGKYLSLDIIQKIVEFDFSDNIYPFYTNSLYKFSVSIGSYDVEIYFILVDISEPNVDKELDPYHLSDTIYVLNYLRTY